MPRHIGSPQDEDGPSYTNTSPGKIAPCCRTLRLREALVNAVTHRNYAIVRATVFLAVFDDRIDVISPGALPNHMTVDQVRASANPQARNDSMGHFMAAMGFMERHGGGWAAGVQRNGASADARINATGSCV